MFKVLISFLLIMFLSGYSFSADIKEADLAGSWYSDNPAYLDKQINNYLDSAEFLSWDEEIVGLICPHAGLIYSGQTAAYGFKAVLNKKIDTAILLGFSHQLSYDGIAVFNSEGFKTPLGTLYTDKDLAERITLQNKKIFSYPQAFQGENSLELILPLVQVALKNPKVLLLAIGEQSFENCQILGEALYEILKDKDNFLIIASTDMSHYLPLSIAQKTDSSSIDLIEKMEPEELFFKCHGQNRMCGIATVASAMIAAKKLGADEIKVLKSSTSAEASGDTSRVVGYLSAAFIKSKDSESKQEDGMAGLLNNKQKEELLKLSRDTIALYVKNKKVLEREFTDPVLKEVMGVFVTLHKNGQLRGCIGNIIGTQPLYLGVREMSIASATQDPRFASLSEDELDDIDIEISVLSPLKKVTDSDKIIMGTHGVLVRQGFRSGVYLPQVATETGWTRDEFMDSLCGHKAGIEPDAWKKGKCEINIFTAEVFGEKND